MQMTIMVPDRTVTINNVSYTGIDMSNLPSSIHAVQWYGQSGWIEYVFANGVKQQNEDINSIEQFGSQVKQWEQKDYEHKNPPPPTAQQNKAIATGKLYETDWATMPDVDILNKSDFIEYRKIIRQYVIEPIDGYIKWPVEPKAVWSNQP